MRIKVLDKGYVRLVEVMGDDRSVVNAARVSYDKETVDFGGNDERLLAFLIREGHTSPLRHAVVTFEAYAPLMVARQWWKYAVASAHLDDQTGWNESSRRYVTENEEFYIPDENSWRTKPENSKQGSGPNFDASYGRALTGTLEQHVDRCLALYDNALELGVAPEQARLFLPAYGLYVRWRWTTSLAGVLHFLDERAEHDAQYEIQQYARAVDEIIYQCFPYTQDAYRKAKK